MGSQTHCQEVAGEVAELHRDFLPVLLAVLAVQGQHRAAERPERLGHRRFPQTTALGAEGEGQVATGGALVGPEPMAALVVEPSWCFTTNRYF